VSSFPSSLPLHACTPKGGKRKRKKKQLMNSGLCLFLNLGLTSTQVGSVVKIIFQKFNLNYF
jgi:hypothetical protein